VNLKKEKNMCIFFYFFNKKWIAKAERLSILPGHFYSVLCFFLEKNKPVHTYKDGENQSVAAAAAAWHVMTKMINTT